MSRSALQSRKWQFISMSWSTWAYYVLCDHSVQHDYHSVQWSWLIIFKPARLLDPYNMWMNVLLFHSQPSHVSWSVFVCLFTPFICLSVCFYICVYVFLCVCVCVCRPDGYTYHEFRAQFVVFSIYISKYLSVAAYLTKSFSLYCSQFISLSV